MSYITASEKPQYRKQEVNSTYLGAAEVRCSQFIYICVCVCVCMCVCVCVCVYTCTNWLPHKPGGGAVGQEVTQDPKTYCED